MIINVRGTAGSGKTTLALRVMKLYQVDATFYQKGRKQPIGYRFRHHNGTTLGVIGHYNTACGGGDTLSAALGMDGIYDLVRKAAAQNTHVLYEGLIICSDWRRVVELAKDYPVKVVSLTTTIQQCLDGITARRFSKKGVATEMKESTVVNVTGKIKTNDGCLRKMREHGVDVAEADRETAFGLIKELLYV